MDKNVQLIRDVVVAFARGDAASIVASVSPDVDWRHPGGPDVPHGGV
ncbi:MAG TPA: hypothetical protein VLA02_04835 [Reyranella sp.]|nr:hypothetical protein [Reyranella sp.]